MRLCAAASVCAAAILAAGCGRPTSGRTPPPPGAPRLIGSPPSHPAETAQPPKPIVLHAKEALIHGSTARYEFGHERDNIGFWTNVSDWVSWDLHVEEPGTFLVQVTQACPADTAGAECELAIGEQTFRVPVKPTGGWGKFVSEAVGILDVPRAGAYPVAFRALTKPKGAVTNLQAVMLVPGRWERGLVAWWPFSEGEGSVTADGLCGSKDTVAFARWTRGVEGRGLRFNGYSSYVARAAAVAPRFRDAFSVEAWVKLLGPPDRWCAIVNQHNYPLGYYFGLDGAGDLGLHLAVGGTWASCTAKAKLPVRQWVHVAATFDRTFGITLYAGGREVGRRWVEGPLTPAPDTDLLIGKHNQHPWVFHVAVDEVKLFSRALEPDEIRTHCEQGRAGIAPPPPIALRGVRPDRTTARAFERVTLDVDLAAPYDNPFDADEVAVEAAVATPSGKTWRVPGFLYQPCDRWLDDMTEAEVNEPIGPPRWQVRLSFREPGTHFIRVAAWDQTGTVMSEPVRVDVSPVDAPGMVRRHAADPRYFVTDRGESFFPVGANVCWAGRRGTYDYDDWLPRYAEQGCNFARLWLSPHWTTLALNTAESGDDAIDLGRAARLDRVVESAERLGLRLMLCIDSFNILRSTERSPGNYEDAPYVRSRGGPLGKPLDYFTNPWSLRNYRNRLRYLVARYGYSPAVFAWEFWNEVDIIDDYHSDTVVAWHKAMARHLRALDPWGHLITTSVAIPNADPILMALPDLDFAQPHYYGAKDMAKELAEKLPVVPMPCFFGEFGIGDGKMTADTDPTGIHLHNALYASVGQGQAGTPMTWWWDSYVDPCGLYPVFGAFARWVQGFDFVAEKARKAEFQILCGDLTLKEPMVLATLQGKWEPADFNRPLTLKVDREGTLTYAVAASELLHGLGFHKDKHNPVTFDLDVPEATKFGVEVKGLSGYGEGQLQISLDGTLVLDKPMPLPENPKDVVHDYDGIYSIDLPAGKHVVKVENTGKDWISVATYKIPWLRQTRSIAEPLRALGLVGEDKALLWVQNKLHTWPNATARNFKPVPIAGAKLVVAGLKPGRWAIEHWDTVKGAVTRTEEGSAGPDGKLMVALPEISWDTALRLKRVGE